MNNLEIKIENRVNGKKFGTSGWLFSKLQKTRVNFNSLKNGEIGCFVEYEVNAINSAEIFKKEMLIAWIGNENSENQFYPTRNGIFYKPIDFNPVVSSLLKEDQFFTEAAKNLLQNFIFSCCDKMIQMEFDKEEDYTFELK